MPTINRRKQNLSAFVELVDAHGLPEVLRSIANLCDRQSFLAGKGYDKKLSEAKLKLASASLGDLANDLEKE